MIESSALYLIIVTILGAGLWTLERRTAFRLFTWLPAIVLIYLLAITLSQAGLFAHNEVQTEGYRLVKSWLLPMMLFLMMLRLDLRAFAHLGKKLLIAYAGAVFSLTMAFTAVFPLFGFTHNDAGVFGALAGSWTGGTANMLAVAGALGLPESQLGPALVVDTLLYTVWVSLLLLLVPAARRFDRAVGAAPLQITVHSGLSAPATLRSLAFLLGIAAVTAYSVQAVSPLLPLLPAATWTVLLASLAGLAGAFTPLKSIGGNTASASFMLYMLIALIGTHASFGGFSEVPRYLIAAATILLLHGLFMIILAKYFRLNLFSIGIASLSNIGGVASAPVLAAAYHRNLVGAAVVMAVMGYLAGTLVGLMIATLLKSIAS